MIYTYVLVIFLILFLVHYFIYYCFVVIFWLFNYKILLWIIFFLLSISFIITSLLLHYYNNQLLKKLYYISSVWHWLLSFLVFWFLLILIISAILHLFNINFNIFIEWLIVVIFSVSIVWYWIYNSKNIVITNVNVNIKNLPSTWKNKKVVMISDVHIWAINWDDFIDLVANKINALDPDLVFIVWDLFDWTDGELNDIDKHINKINAKQWIYFVNWNHETYIRDGIVSKTLLRTRINILDNEIVNIDWVQIIWLSYLEKWFWSQNVEDVLNSLKKYDKKIPSILLFHTPLFIQNFIDFGINLQLSWHTHKWQFWPYGYFSKLIYNWKDYWLYTYKDYNLYTSNWVWTWWPPLRIWKKPEIVLVNFKPI